MLCVRIQITMIYRELKTNIITNNLIIKQNIIIENGSKVEFKTVENC